MYRAATISICLLITGTAFADDRETEVGYFLALAKAHERNMYQSFTCDEYIGYTPFRTARREAKSAYTFLLGNKNEAILAVDKIEKDMRASNTKSEFQALVRESSVSDTDVRDTCLELLARIEDEIEVLQARIGIAIDKTKARK